MRRVLLLPILILCAVFLILPVMAQTYGTQYKGVSASSHAGDGVSASRYTSVYDVSGMQSFRSTSSLTLSGSELPMASATGVSFAVWSSGPLREGENPFGDETVVDISTPTEPGVPVGDIPWIWLFLLAGGYALRLRRRQNNEQ